jgi:hypothetical protein
MNDWRLPRVLAMTAASILPVRLAKILLRVLCNAAGAGLLGSYLVTFPVVATAHAARLAGEVAGYFDDAGR